ncbi:hypothetical protein TA3x_005816 (plasmid) [Tundrisphaera sp. TA3]|uniref:hypothetical protein n=1 Tax=Tundrisphaera sp. TA3 TaxID=3435775 RepID=UPI003EBBC32C
MVSASEIASWEWCPESWRLHAIGHKSGNREALERGTEHHTEKAVFEKRSRSAISLGWWLIVLGGLAALALAYALVSA